MSLSGWLITAAIVAIGSFGPPFHNKSWKLAPARMGQRPYAALRSRLIASMKFDLPEPFGPIKMLRGLSSSGGVSPPKESQLRSIRLRIVGGFPMLHVPSDNASNTAHTRSHLSERANSETAD